LGLTESANTTKTLDGDKETGDLCKWDLSNSIIFVYDDFEMLKYTHY